MAPNTFINLGNSRDLNRKELQETIAKIWETVTLDMTCRDGPLTVETYVSILFRKVESPIVLQDFSLDEHYERLQLEALMAVKEHMGPDMVWELNKKYFVDETGIGFLKLTVQ